MNMNDGLVFSVTMDEYFKFVAKWLEHPTSIMELVGSIPTRNSEISISFNRCQATSIYNNNFFGSKMEKISYFCNCIWSAVLFAWFLIMLLVTNLLCICIEFFLLMCFVLRKDTDNNAT